MKKKLLFLVCLVNGIIAFSQNLSIPKFEFPFNENQDVNSLLEGEVIYAENNPKKVKKSSNNIPEEFANGVVIVEYAEKYYYYNEVKNRKFQIIYSNINPDKKFLKASEKKPIKVASNEIIGKAKGSIKLVIRARDLDPYLVLCARSIPLEEGPFWYYGLESLDPSVAKYLSFQPVNSKDTEIVFPDGKAETFEHIVKSRSPEAVSTFPAMPIKIKTVMNAMPAQKHSITNSTEKIINDKYFANLNLEVTVEVFGINVHIYFPDNFAAYFEKEYKTGDPIWFFGNILYVYNGELHMYGRDFSLADPDATVNDKQNVILMRNRQNRNNKAVDDSNDYVDVTQTIPKGGYAVYERFFYQDEKSPTGFTENRVNSAIEYFDKNGNRVARMFPDKDSVSIRSTQTYKYDKKNRIVEYCVYESYSYQEKGQWKVDPKKSRLFNKDVTEYQDSSNGYDAVKTSYRYSYKPAVEHLEQKTFMKYSANGILLRTETKHVNGDEYDSLSEYDDKGNIVYSRGFGEEKYEFKYEYVYDGDKIISEKRTDLISGKVVEVSCSYDEKGNLIERKNEDFTTTFKYNKNGKLVETCQLEKDGNISFREIKRYDKKTGILLFNYEERFGKYSNKRFWYYELSKDNWDYEITPEKILKMLEE